MLVEIIPSQSADHATVSQLKHDLPGAGCLCLCKEDLRMVNKLVCSLHKEWNLFVMNQRSE